MGPNVVSSELKVKYKENSTDTLTVSTGSQNASVEHVEGEIQQKASHRPKLAGDARLMDSTASFSQDSDHLAATLEHHGGTSSEESATFSSSRHPEGGVRLPRQATAEPYFSSGRISPKKKLVGEPAGPDPRRTAKSELFASESAGQQHGAKMDHSSLSAPKLAGDAAEMSESLTFPRNHEDVAKLARPATTEPHFSSAMLPASKKIGAEPAGPDHRNTSKSEQFALKSAGQKNGTSIGPSSSSVPKLAGEARHHEDGVGLPRQATAEPHISSARLPPTMKIGAEPAESWSH